MVQGIGQTGQQLGPLLVVSEVGQGLHHQSGVSFFVQGYHHVRCQVRVGVNQPVHDSGRRGYHGIALTHDSKSRFLVATHHCDCGGWLGHYETLHGEGVLTKNPGHFAWVSRSPSRHNPIHSKQIRLIDDEIPRRFFNQNSDAQRQFFQAGTRDYAQLG